MHLGRALSWAAERFPERTAIGGPDPLTYRQWDARTSRYARALADAGALPADRVVFLLANGEPLASLHMAAQKLGVVSTPLNTRYGAGEVAYCVADAEPAVVVTDRSTAGFLEPIRESLSGSRKPAPAFLHVDDEVPPGSTAFEALAAVQPDGPLRLSAGPEDPSVMLYTSGTTGRPKGVPRTQHNEWSAALAHAVQCRYDLAGETTLGAMPLFHTMGIRSLLSMLVVGGCWTPVPTLEPALVAETLRGEGVSCLYLVPTAFFALLHAGALDGAPGVRKLAYAGAPMAPSLCEQLSAALDPDVFVNHFGSTEIYTYTVSHRQRDKPGCAGRPGMFSRIRLVSADPEGRAGPGDVVAAGERGEVVAHLDSDEAFAGYWRRPDADERALRDGWYFTGDLGHLDGDGDLWVVGRVDDMVITGGENVHPIEVEDALARCPDVADAAVAGLPDEKWGQAVTAFVVPAGEAGLDAGRDAGGAAARIEAWLRDASGLAGYKRPKRVVLVSEIPKSPVGKILRRKLVAGE
ncbi:MAG: class I adenylate-forming enzyme family protein, partial [Carbonactinosporaceae bacterium]